ncbi:DUF2868 domain-containing protein [Marinomonas profundimaris]|uniref:DUF2868 domain-containing protein n=1 Tax=Marinomonas profundimaris TaxID=1208321 RepID=W1RQT9_9GAMM|nr:DUF2868 domain-containing protein [Marinomonas profundimaris]ETI57859.1 hypothetical protein D104_18150 [Marinomonas profundimaris]
MTFPTHRAKLALAAWLETHTAFRLSVHARNLTDALDELDTSPQPISYLTQFISLKRYFNRVILGILAMAFVLGLIAVPPAFATSQSSQVNIFWLFIVLLGFHALNLTLWFATMLATMNSRYENKGVLLSALIFINKKVSKHSHLSEESTSAYLHWQCPTHANKWLVSSLSHGAWGCYLLAGWIMTLLLLLTNQVNFVWETTLLSDDAFIQLTQTLNQIPAWFGIALPNQLDILASRVDLLSQNASTRQHWANFLLASIMIYGVLPRLVFLLLSIGMYHFKRATQPLSTQERMIKNRYSQQEKQSRVIVDSDHQASPISSGKNHNAHVSTLDDNAFSEHWALFEWSTPTPDYLRSARSVAILNSREEQEQFLNRSSQAPIYILVNGEQSPDRGSRRFFAKISPSYSSVTLVIFGGENARFLEDWQRLARETPMPFTHIIQKD